MCTFVGTHTGNTLQPCPRAKDCNPKALFYGLWVRTPPLVDRISTQSQVAWVHLTKRAWVCTQLPAPCRWCCFSVAGGVLHTCGLPRLHRRKNKFLWLGQNCAGLRQIAPLGFVSVCFGRTFCGYRYAWAWGQGGCPTKKTLGGVVSRKTEKRGRRGQRGGDPKGFAVGGKPLPVGVGVG